jgi:hypothetical protein
MNALFAFNPSLQAVKWFRSLRVFLAYTTIPSDVRLRTQKGATVKTSWAGDLPEGVGWGYVGYPTKGRAAHNKEPLPTPIPRGDRDALSTALLQ